MHATVTRLRARLALVPPRRLRRLLLALYLATAALDAAGKALAANPTVNRAMSRLVTGEQAADLRVAARPSGNFEIFRTASRHLFAQKDLYAEYPADHSDRFKYSPTFALLFAPFAWLPWPIALFLWSAVNALVLFVAIERALPARAAMFALLCMHLEVLRAMQNAQSNALVAGLIILAYALQERGQTIRAAAAVALGACVKIFPLAALTFAVTRRRVLSTGVWFVVIGVLALALPLVATSPATLLDQYRSWRGVESIDAQMRWFSVMELIHRWSGRTIPNWPIQLAGVATLMLPLALRRDRWNEDRFRRLYLSSVLLFVVLFNHQAERASYLIAFAGATLWFAGEPGAPWRTGLYLLALVSIPLLSTLAPGAIWREPSVMFYRLVLPSLAIWLMIQRELLASTAAVIPSGVESPAPLYAD